MITSSYQCGVQCDMMMWSYHGWVAPEALLSGSLSTCNLIKSWYWYDHFINIIEDCLTTEIDNWNNICFESTEFEQLKHWIASGTIAEFSACFNLHEKIRGEFSSWLRCSLTAISEFLNLETWVASQLHFAPPNVPPGAGANLRRSAYI